MGELFGQSVDAVLHRPRAVLVPFLIDVGTLALGTGLFVLIASVNLLFPQGYRLPDFPVAVPHALPTVGDIMGPTPSLHTQTAQTILAAGALVLLTVPLLAYCEAGFLGVLRAVYLAPNDPIIEGRHPDAWSRIRESFAESARRHFGTFALLRCIQAALALVALVLPAYLPLFGSYGLGVLAVDVLLLYAPYAAIEGRKGFVASVRESIQLVSDHLATTLVALLFGFLLTGGMALLVPPLTRVATVGTPFVAAALYAPVGTALSLFLYRVYLGFYPRETLPESAPAPVSAPAGA